MVVRTKGGLQMTLTTKTKDSFPYHLHGNSKHDQTIYALFCRWWELTRTDIQEMSNINPTRIGEVIKRMKENNILKWRDDYKGWRKGRTRYYRLA